MANVLIKEVQIKIKSSALFETGLLEYVLPGNTVSVFLLKNFSFNSMCFLSLFKTFSSNF